jgi:hypothetical protein
MRRRNQLVDTLLDHIRPVVERLAMDLAHIAAARIERELGRVSEAVEVALSTYASDRPDLITAALGPELAAMLTPPKPRPTQLCSVHREVFDLGRVCPSCAKDLDLDELDRQLGPELAAERRRRAQNFTREGQTSDVPARAEAAESKSAVEAPVSEADSKRGAPRESGNGGFRVTPGKVTCHLCGFVGGNARGCGKPRGHVPIGIGDLADGTPEAADRRLEESARELGPPPAPPRAKTGPDDQPLTAIEPQRRLKPKPEAVAAAKARIEERRARLRAQAESAQASTRRAAEPEVDDNPTADVRWSPDRIEHAKTIAESLKRDGELPTPLSSWEF